MDEVNTIEEFRNLIRAFERVSPLVEKPAPTYLEITRKGHDEAIISNLLAFFFDPKQPHGLGNLFIKSFFQCMAVSEANIDEDDFQYVAREVTTAQGKRIDLLVESKSWTLAIENKIYHSLGNDLDEYAAHIRRLDKVKNCHLAVLSVYPQGVAAGGYANVTYDAFINCLETSITDSSASVEKYYYPFLIDFFTTIKNLKSQYMHNEKFRQFLVENATTVGRFDEEKKHLDDLINSKLHELQSLTNVRPDVQKFIWLKFVAINQKVFPNKMWLKADCSLDYDGYRIRVFVQRHGDATTDAILKAIPYFNESNNWDTSVTKQPIPFDTPVQEVADIMNEVLQNVFP